MRKKAPRIQAPDPGAGLVTEAFRSEVIETLNAYPYFAVLEGRKPDTTPHFTLALAASLTASPAERSAITIKTVRYNPEVKTHAKGATNFSSTAHALEAHTDSTFMPRPHEFIAFQFVKADPTGGDTIMMPVEDVLGRLSPRIRAAAAEMEFFWGQFMAPILTGDADRPSIRYYRTQLDTVAGGALKRADRIEIADAVSAAVAASHEDYRFHAEPGETVLINNTKTLHSRTAFSETSERLMWRIRANTALIG